MATENEVTQSKQSGADGFGNVSARSEFQAVGDLPRSQGAEGWPSDGRRSHSPPAGGMSQRPLLHPLSSTKAEAHALPAEQHGVVVGFAGSVRGGTAGVWQKYHQDQDLEA